MWISRSLAVFAAAALFAACDANESLLGEFEARLQTDDAVEAIEGEAVYSVVETADGPRFVLGLFVGDLIDSDRDDYDFIAFGRDGDVPSIGAYAVSEDPRGRQAVTATYADVEDADDAIEAEGAIVRGTDGTLTITNVTRAGFVVGAFQFEGEGFRVEAPSVELAASASGRFEARYVTPARLRSLGVELGM